MVVEIQEINSLLKQDVSVENISSRLSPWAAALFDFLPIFIKKQVGCYSFLNLLCLHWATLLALSSPSLFVVFFSI